MRKYRKRARPDDLVTAAEIACWVYCPEQWRLEYGQGLAADNKVARDAGDRHHAGKAVAEQIAGGSISLGRFLAAVAAVVLLWLLWRWL
jgi:hypothetical protein